jgi:hypothetical protein
MEGRGFRPALELERGLRALAPEANWLQGKGPFNPPPCDGGAKQAAEKRLNAVILSPAKNLALPLRANYAKDLALFIFKAMRVSSFRKAQDRRCSSAETLRVSP